MKKKKYIILGILAIVFLFVIGVSYAVWQITLQQETSNVITTGCFQIEFSDKNAINLEKAYPISDAEGKSLVPYEFTITNTCNSFASYQINLEILNTTTLENLDYLKVMLDSKVNLLTENESVIKTLDNAKTSYKLKTGYLRENGSKTFSLRLWMDENTPTSEEFMNKVFESKVTVIATYKENLDNNIEASAVSQNESFSESETFLIHATSENYDLISMSDDLETWEDLETKGKDITIEKTVTQNGNHTFYFQDEAENVQDVTVTATKIDDKKPIANMSVTKSSNVISINASNSLDNETSISKYYYSKDGTNYVESTNSTYEFPIFDYGMATKMLEDYKNQKVYVKVEDEYQNVSDIKEYSLGVNELLYDETADNNLRYVGASPNNYVSFNNELWRIIGVMNNVDDGTGKKETRLKLIRNESIGNYSWDTSASNINNGHGINEWSQADVMKLMNPGYESEVVGGSLYWNRTNGNCYIEQSNVYTSCDFTTIGLLKESREMIEQLVWNTGSNEPATDEPMILTSQFYELERSKNASKICSREIYCNDMVTRTFKWKGYVGLMYPSDYGFATSGGTTTSRETCLNTVLYNWYGSDISDCKNNDWLLKSEMNQRTIVPCTISDVADTAFNLYSRGNIGGYDSIRTSYGVFPVLYLKSNIAIINGIGTMESPFELSQ